LCVALCAKREGMNEYITKKVETKRVVRIEEFKLGKDIDLAQ